MAILWPSHGEQMKDLRSKIQAMINEAYVRDEDHPQLWVSGFVAALWAVLEKIDEQNGIE